VTQAPPIIERAFELAREGSCRTVEDIRRSLKKERYGDADSHLAGSSLVKQLKAELAKQKP
jgi:hypothetical protein